ncbi:alpha/beta hydrolase family esterase [Rhodoferax ferrireducens]|uniref:extracellular catalytic domain type 1 short-chain-length polyhydroxyalkanoate depolymerase n=1 Tax=Rhodoferax ferrireducens TaxID=192843 RepID=UPI001E3F342C|nr:PHB depolymerase family esterase [Rhodoferax ferrireducens]
MRRTLTAMTRTAMRAGTQAVKQALRAQPGLPKAKAKTKSRSTPAKPASAAHWRTDLAVGPAGARRYHLYKPPGLRRTERLPLLVMLHGCGQDAHALAAISRMNQIALRHRFLVLYPEQDRLANMQGCWNWYDTRSGRAQGEADVIQAAIDQVCLAQPVDPKRVALAGLSAGAGMAALLATRHPERFRAVAMHSGIAPGVAQSSVTALRAMRGHRMTGVPLAPLAAGVHLPALLVIQGSADHLVAPANGAEAARLWAAREGAQAGGPRTVQRGARYSAMITDFKTRGRLVAALCTVTGLGHAWSGGAPSWTYSDPKGPDASRMIWAFVAKQFASVRD